MAILDIVTYTCSSSDLEGLTVTNIICFVVTLYNKSEQMFV